MFSSFSSFFPGHLWLLLLRTSTCENPSDGSFFVVIDLFQSMVSIRHTCIYRDNTHNINNTRISTRNKNQQTNQENANINQGEKDILTTKQTPLANENKPHKSR